MNAPPRSPGAIIITCWTTSAASLPSGGMVAQLWVPKAEPSSRGSSSLPLKSTVSFFQLPRAHGCSWMFKHQLPGTWFHAHSFETSFLFIPLWAAPRPCPGVGVFSYHLTTTASDLEVLIPSHSAANHPVWANGHHKTKPAEPHQLRKAERWSWHHLNHLPSPLTCTYNSVYENYAQWKTAALIIILTTYRGL